MNWSHYLGRRTLTALLLGLLIGSVTTWRVIEVVQTVSGTGDGDYELAAAESALALSAAAPTRLRIPAIKLDVTFVGGLGINERGEIETPTNFTDVGWYKNGPTPGEIGPAVVVGHIDSYLGPAVLYNLRHVEVGDEIFIDRVDGITAVFTVTDLKYSNQDAFPTSEVYGDLDYAGLRLITCSGTYEKRTQRYSHNLIVSARLTATTSPQVF